MTETLNIALMSVQKMSSGKSVDKKKSFAPVAQSSIPNESYSHMRAQIYIGELLSHKTNNLQADSQFIITAKYLSEIVESIISKERHIARKEEATNIANMIARNKLGRMPNAISAVCLADDIMSHSKQIPAD